MIWVNHGVGSIRQHPIHLHGHSYRVLKLGYPPQHRDTAHMIGTNTDIDCGNTSLDFCNNPKWANKAWNKGNADGLKKRNAPIKDTLNIPAGAYAVVRFRTDNPGEWFIHCHVEMHSMQGMALVLREAPNLHPAPPPGFPTCHNFLNIPGEDHGFAVPDSPVEKDHNYTSTNSNIYLILICTLVGVVCLQSILLVLSYCRHQPNSQSIEKEKAIELKTCETTISTLTL